MLLEINGVSAGYFNKRVINDVTMHVDKGEVVGLIGHNGAGKTTTLKTILGLIKSDEGLINFQGLNITGHVAVKNVHSGMRFIPQERFTFPDLTVMENIMLGAHHVERKEIIDASLKEVLRKFPFLESRNTQKAGTMSGGQQRILSIAMVMMAQPKFVMLDEPSLGLSPLIVQEIGTIVRNMADKGMSILLVDQSVKQTAKISDRVYVMKNGRIVLEETGKKLLERGNWWDLF